MTILIKRYSTRKKWLAECSRRKKKNESKPKNVVEGIGSKTILRKRIDSHFEPVCPECNAKHGPFNSNEIESILEIQCDSCGFILTLDQLRNFD